MRVRAAGVNPLDGKIRSGALEAVFPTTLPAIPGLEVAGVVDALGEGVSTVAVGDAVLGWSDTGSYAEYALVSDFAAEPEGLSWESAVTLPVAVEAAERVLGMLGVAAGETVLIHGALSGAVGTVAVQLATALGAQVIGTAGPGNQDYLAGLGGVRPSTAMDWSSGYGLLPPTVWTPCSMLRARARCPTRSSCAVAPSASSPSPTSAPGSSASPSRPDRRSARPPVWRRWPSGRRRPVHHHRRRHLPAGPGADRPAGQRHRTRPRQARPHPPLIDPAPVVRRRRSGRFDWLEDHLIAELVELAPAVGSVWPGRRGAGSSRRRGRRGAR